MESGRQWRVLIVNEASPNIGMGHILRDQALARELFSRGKYVGGITIGDERAVAYSRERTRRDGFEWPVEIARSVADAIRKILQMSPSAVILDLSTSGENVVAACTDAKIPVVALDYFSHQKPLPWAIVNLIDHSTASIVHRTSSSSGAQYFEGPEFSIIRSEFFGVRKDRTARGERPQVRNVLVAFGGADPSGNTRHAINTICDWPEEYVVDVVVGPLFKKENNLSVRDVDSRITVRKHDAPENMGSLFQDADVIFCGGGGTLLEALCVGVPAIVMAQNAAEVRHAKSLADRGACWLAGEVGWNEIESIGVRTTLADQARTTVDGRGVTRICDIVDQFLH